jgi:hypothetical protein
MTRRCARSSAANKKAPKATRHKNYSRSVQIDVCGVPKKIVALIDDAVRIGRYKSRSEAIVAAIVHALRDGAV